MTELEKTIEIIKATAEKNRLRIMMMLTVRPLCVCEIDAVLGIALSTISAHLKQMRSAGVIISQKEGRWVIYHLSDDPAVNSVIKGIRSCVEDDPEILADAAKVSMLRRDECASCKC